MTDIEETIVYDVLDAVMMHSDVLRALAQRDGSTAARAAYLDGVHYVGIKLQHLLSVEAMARCKARRESILNEAVAFFAKPQ